MTDIDVSQLEQQMALEADNDSDNLPLQEEEEPRVQLAFTLQHLVVTADSGYEVNMFIKSLNRDEPSVVRVGVDLVYSGDYRMYDLTYDTETKKFSAHKSKDKKVYRPESVSPIALATFLLVLEKCQVGKCQLDKVVFSLHNAVMYDCLEAVAKTRPFSNIVCTFVLPIHEHEQVAPFLEKLERILPSSWCYAFDSTLAAVPILGSKTVEFLQRLCLRSTVDCWDVDARLLVPEPVLHSEEKTVHSTSLAECATTVRYSPVTVGTKPKTRQEQAHEEQRLAWLLQLIRLPHIQRLNLVLDQQFDVDRNLLVRSYPLLTCLDLNTNPLSVTEMLRLLKLNPQLQELQVSLELTEKPEDESLDVKTVLAAVAKTELGHFSYQRRMKGATYTSHTDHISILSWAVAEQCRVNLDRSKTRCRFWSQFAPTLAFLRTWKHSPLRFAILSFMPEILSLAGVRNLVPDLKIEGKAQEPLWPLWNDSFLDTTFACTVVYGDNKSNKRRIE